MTRTIVKSALIVILLAFLFAKGIWPAWTTVHSDFANYYMSSTLLVEKADLNQLYNNNWFGGQIRDHGIDLPGKFAPFPPATAWVMIPLTPFDPLTAQRIWTLFNVLFLLLNVLLIDKITQWKTSTSLLLVLAGGLCLANNFAFGQLYLGLSCFLFLGYWQLSKGKALVGGSTLGFFAIIKYFPVVFLLGYFLDKKYRLVAISCITMLTLLIIQYIFFGNRVMSDYITQAFLPHLDGNLESQNMYSFQFQSWDGFLRYVFVKDEMNNPNPLIDWAAGRIWIKSSIMLAIAGGTGLLIRKIYLTGEAHRLPLMLCVIGLGTMAILPASATYHFVLLIFPITLLLQTNLFIRNEQIATVSLFAVIGFIPYKFLFAIADHLGYFFAYPRLWLTNVLFILVTVLINKNLNDKHVSPIIAA